VKAFSTLTNQKVLGKPLEASGSPWNGAILEYSTDLIKSLRTLCDCAKTKRGPCHGTLPDDVSARPKNVNTVITTQIES
jgi:hypothetical protein